MNPNLTLSDVKACILGHAVGDALGLPVEFYKRETLEADPVKGMRAHGSFDMPAGSWSDDTSMTLCGLDALAQETFSWNSVMVNFGKWYYDSEFTPTEETFDVGSTCSKAIHAFFLEEKGISECGQRGEGDNGNGSLMRILPFALYAPNDLDFIEKASSLTHAHRRAQMACGIYNLVLDEILTERSKDAVRRGVERAKRYYIAEPDWEYYEPLLSIEERERESICSGGYVVDTLEAALWCLLTTDSYKKCVLKAVNLGRDTDTTAAVAGGLAGALYGLDAIPKKWQYALLKRNVIENLCEKAWERWSGEK